MAEMIRCADETLARLGIDDPIDVVGHSMGGFVALAYAVERPDRVRPLVLITGLSGYCMDNHLTNTRQNSNSLLKSSIANLTAL